MFSYYQLTQLNDDKCTIDTDEKQSVMPFDFETYYGYVPETSEDYVNKITPQQLRRREYWNMTQYPDVDSALTHAPLTHRGEIRELYARPFKTQPYRGADQMSIEPSLVDYESMLRLGTHCGTRRVGDYIPGSAVNRFTPLPEYGNPQRVEHVVEPWVRGGVETRDETRRITPQEIKTILSFNIDGTPNFK